MKRGFAFKDSPVTGEWSNPVSSKKLRAGSGPSRDISAKKVLMQKWEYCIFEVKGIHSDQDRTERVDELNKLGAAGWEPAGTTSGGSQYHEYLIFKRPKS